MIIDFSPLSIFLQPHFCSRPAFIAGQSQSFTWLPSIISSGTGALLILVLSSVESRLDALKLENEALTSRQDGMYGD